MIDRKEYLEMLIKHKEHKIIKVITGVRRCGKSTLFELYKNYLKKNGVKSEQIISLNLEDLEYEELLDYRKLYSYVIEKLCKDKFTYVFIDEVQNCSNFEKVIDSLFIKENVDVYITGSNAYMLSGELATLLSGRYITIDMLPLSFAEYKYANIETDKTVQEMFNDYISYGSFPYIALNYKNKEVFSSYLEGIYNSILIKDVVKREGITDVTLLINIVKTLTSSIGSPISIKKITDTLVSSGRKVTTNTIDRYVRALCDSYIFYKVDRYDIRGRQFLKTLGKYYIVDTGIRNLLLSSSSSDIGHLIENVVYFELLRRGYKVNIGKFSEKEVDFVASNFEKLMYVQVSLTVLDELTLEREISPLRAIKDNHPKILLTLDEIGTNFNYEGIKCINLLKWLLNDY